MGWYVCAGYRSYLRPPGHYWSTVLVGGGVSHIRSHYGTIGGVSDKGGRTMS